MSTLVRALLAATFLAGCATAEAPKPQAAKVTPAKKKKKAEPEKEVAAVDAAAEVSVGPSWVDKRPRNGETRHRPRFVFPFDVESLPVEVVNSSASKSVAPLGSTEGDPAPEIVIKKQPYAYYGYGSTQTYNTVSVEGEGFTSGTIKIGPTEGTFSMVDGNKYGGVSVACSPTDYTVPAHWEGLVTKTKNGKVETTYESVDGWFDRKTCKARVTKRTSIKVAEIISGTVYGFRQCSDANCTDKTNVALVFPGATNVVTDDGVRRGSSGAVASRVLMPVRRGGSESVLASVPGPRGAYKPRVVSVEILQSTTDQKPIATAFVEDPK